MGNKIQGEGDYEAGRRFQEEEHEFVKRKYGKRNAVKDLDLDLDLSAQSEDDIEDDQDTQIADNRGLSRAKRPDQDSTHRR